MATTTINWRRVVVSGIVSGFVWGVLYAIVHEAVEAHDAAGKPVLPLTPFHGAGFAIRVIVIANPLVLGIAALWLYAAIRPRFGPGPRTAALAGFAVWLLGSWVQVSWAAFTDIPPRLLIGPLGSSLLLAVPAAMLGGWLYRE